MSDGYGWVVGCGRFLFEIISSTHHFLDHVHNLLLYHIQTLCIASRGSANNVINLDIIVILSNPSAVHRVGKFNKNRVFLHNSLNVLTANTNDAFVVLVRNMERYGCRHFLLDQIKSVLSSFVLSPTYVDIEVVLIEPVKYNLHIA